MNPIIKAMPQPEPPPDDQCRVPARKDEDEPCLYCPRCDSRLTELKCKLICEKCGYYMSCSDYY
jgi:hypothetical protein